MQNKTIINFFKEYGIIVFILFIGFIWWQATRPNYPYVPQCNMNELKAGTVVGYGNGGWTVTDMNFAGSYGYINFASTN